MSNTAPTSRGLIGVVVIAAALLLGGCGRIDELEAQVSSLESESEEMREKITELERQVQEFEEKVEEVQQALSQVDSDLDDVERQTILLNYDDKFGLESAVGSLRDSVDTAVAEAD